MIKDGGKANKQTKKERHLQLMESYSWHSQNFQEKHQIQSSSHSIISLDREIEREREKLSSSVKKRMAIDDRPRLSRRIRFLLLSWLRRTRSGEPQFRFSFPSFRLDSGGFHNHLLFPDYILQFDSTIIALDYMTCYSYVNICTNMTCYS